MGILFECLCFINLAILSWKKLQQVHLILLASLAYVKVMVGRVYMTIFLQHTTVYCRMRLYVNIIYTFKIITIIMLLEYVYCYEFFSFKKFSVLLAGCCIRSLLYVIALLE